MGIGNAQECVTQPNTLESHYPSWGSGTAAHVVVVFRHLSTHYPSWGSGTSCAWWPRFSSPLLITPHGDREQAPSTHIPHSPRFSLPLMGIGNRVGEQVVRQALLLITPHGDREPGCWRWLRQVQEPLITPHGDRERLSADDLGVREFTSLPLMGIGNLRIRAHRHHSSGRLITPHGDREHEHTSTWRRHHRISLPLMGIGNPRARPSGPRCRSELITPHGDREHTHARVHVLKCQISLPLMGIGNPPYSTSFAPSTPRKRLKIPL